MTSTPVVSAGHFLTTAVHVELFRNSVACEHGQEIHFSRRRLRKINHFQTSFHLSIKKSLYYRKLQLSAFNSKNTQFFDWSFQLTLVCLNRALIFSTLTRRSSAADLKANSSLF